MSNSPTREFDVGNVVVLKSGSKPMTVVRVFKPTSKDTSIHPMSPTDYAVQAVCWNEGYGKDGGDMVKFCYLPSKSLKFYDNKDNDEQTDNVEDKPDTGTSS